MHKCKMSTDMNKLFWFWLKIFLPLWGEYFNGWTHLDGEGNPEKLFNKSSWVEAWECSCPKAWDIITALQTMVPDFKANCTGSPSPARALLVTHTLAHSQVYLAKGRGLILISFRFCYCSPKILNMPVPTNWKLKRLNCWVCAFPIGFWFLLRSSMLCVMNKNATIS